MTPDTYSRKSKLHWDTFDRIVNAVDVEVERLTNERNTTKADAIVDAVQRLYQAIVTLFQIPEKPVNPLENRKIVYYKMPGYMIGLPDEIILKLTLEPMQPFDYLYLKFPKNGEEEVHSIAGALNISSWNPFNALGGTRGPLYGESEALTNVKNHLLKSS